MDSIKKISILYILNHLIKIQMKRIRSERDEVKNITASSLKKRKEEFLKNRENLLKEKIVKK